MQLEVTGDLRAIANSAWISTTDEISAKSRTDDDVRRVTEFLVANHHTSPFECVTLTFSSYFGDTSMKTILAPYIESSYSRYDEVADCNEQCLSIDLLNFVKITKKRYSILEDSEAWNLFQSSAPELASVLSKFSLLGEKVDNADNADSKVGSAGMNVELVSYHKSAAKRHSRITWRIRCPLSIAVQILRHRTASANMVSGRYRTINQDMVGTLDDCSEIFSLINRDYDDYFGVTDLIFDKYEELMSDAKQAKNNSTISNDQYKRLREVARYILPEGRLTELYITMYADDFDHYLKLRNTPHAQVEHVWIAQQMLKVVQDFENK